MKIQLSEYFQTSLAWFKIELTKVKDTCQNTEIAIIKSNAATLIDLIEDIEPLLRENGN